MPVVSLLSDFGLLDPFVAEMKAVIFPIIESCSVGVTSMVSITSSAIRFSAGPKVRCLSVPMKVSSVQAESEKRNLTSHTPSILGVLLGEVAVSHQTATTVSGAEVRLYEDVLDRIFRKHGELRGMETLITDTVASPDLVPAGHGRELVAVKHYAGTSLGAKNMVVVYREDKHLIITAFLTSDRSKLVRRRTTIWQRQSK